MSKSSSNTVVVPPPINMDMDSEGLAVYNENGFTVGTEKPQKQPNNFILYPNPATDKLTCDIPYYDSPVDLQIFTLNGKCIFNCGSILFPKSLDIGYLPKGIYILKIRTNYSILTEKFIKQ